MKAAMRTDGADQPGAHLRLVRPRRRNVGDQAFGVSKTYRSRDGVCRRCGRSISTSPKASSLSWSARPAVASRAAQDDLRPLPPSTGEVLVEGEPVTKPHGNVGIVFQNSLLLPWRNILSNVMLPIDMKRLPRDHLPRKGALETCRPRGL
jgi:NitT/TauT family transport system ATP-binding protein